MKFCMNIRNVWRLCYLSLTAFFWTDCSNASSTSPPASEDFIDPSADIASSSTNEHLKLLLSSSSKDFLKPLSSSSSTMKYVLARDSSVTCEKDSVGETLYPPKYSCSELQELLSRDTAVYKSALKSWEDDLMSCGAIDDVTAAYGVPSVSSGLDITPRYVFKMRCSNDETYVDYSVDENLIYTSWKEYYDAIGLKPESFVESCPQGDFALFADILADVQKQLYERIEKKLEDAENISEKRKVFLEQLLDRANKKLKGTFTPYLWTMEDYPVEEIKLNFLTKNWFNGYIARTETCADGTSEMTALYQEKYAQILQECRDLINDKVNSLK
ncbi:MAG: hypothetical protein IKS02_03810 [Fibrobacter sp.]|nr:hypothetical protein [Fibrobacter sp.]